MARVYQIGMAAVLAVGSVSADDYSQWGHALNLYTNTSPDGAYVTTVVNRFPLLVRLNAGNFSFSEAQGKGQDIRFADPAGKHLPYQIERWDSTAAAAEVWVLMDSIRANTIDQSLRMLWGKADAADSSNGAAVFDSADGFVGVWHLGSADTLARANSVPGGLPAAPVNYDGDESRPGVIGMADSLDGAGTGDYLNLGQGYADFNRGFTYSVWANPTDKAYWSRLLDMGNGAGVDNIVLQRYLTTSDLLLDTYNGTAGGKRVAARSAFASEEWQYFAVTVGDKVASIYRNGVLVASEKQADTLIPVKRLLNYIGKSNWPGNAYFKGKIDEARLSKRARSADWIKLSYASQNPSQTLLAFLPPASGCTARFDAPKDTALAEGSLIDLGGTADCAGGYYWEVISGPGPRILDPEVKSLRVALPRVTRESVIKYRFNARYADATVSKDIDVTVLEAVPEPTFTLPAGLTWNGKDSLLFKAKVGNLAAIRASKDSVLNWSWTLADMEADTAWREDGLLLKSAAGEGPLKIGLCLDNDGPAICKTAKITVGPALSIAPIDAARNATERTGFDARGRRLQGKSLRRVLSVFGFFR
ncbi:MAG: hypothetical protein JWO30_1062 [Fibrobacteres bacterium]|nr:hypothetical protein [Fibrobacterota bacterium]